MKSYEEFKQDFVEDLKANLANVGHDNLSMDFTNVEKMSGNYEGLTIREEGSNIGMTFNVSKAFEAYENGAEYGSVVTQATIAVDKGIKDMPVVNPEELTNYEVMKEKLCVEVVSAEKNADLLEKVPHENLEDMAVVYRFQMESNENGRASILVTNEMIDRMGVTPEQLKADALENAPEIRPAAITDIKDVLREMPDVDDFTLMMIDTMPDNEILVASTEDKQAGAGILAYQDFMDQAAERVGGDFFVLPSSVHEILLVPDDGLKTADELRFMVQEVNATQVAPEDKLTDSVYHYDAKEHIFELAEKFEARQQEKKSDLGEQEQDTKSLLKELNSKKKEVEAKPPTRDAAEKATKSKGGEAL